MKRYLLEQKWRNEECESGLFSKDCLFHMRKQTDKSCCKHNDYENLKITIENPRKSKL